MPKLTRLQESEHLEEELRTLLNDEDLDLQARFYLDLDDNEERREAAVSEFCKAFALFFDIASRSKP